MSRSLLLEELRKTGQVLLDEARISTELLVGHPCPLKEGEDDLAAHVIGDHPQRIAHDGAVGQGHVVIEDARPGRNCEGILDDPIGESVYQ